MASLMVLTSGAQTNTSTPSGPGGSAPTGTSTPTATVTGTSPVSATSITDTEYVSVRMDANGQPLDVKVKEWWRVRGPGGSEMTVKDPGTLESIRSLSGPRPRIRDGSMRFSVDLPDEGHDDVYIAGVPKKVGDKYHTSEGPQDLPVSVKIRYYVGSDEPTTQVNARQFSRHHGPFKLVITVQNNTKRTQEVIYNDVQTKQNVTGIAEVYTPFTVKVGTLALPDSQFDAVHTNGSISRRGDSTLVDWTLYLAPPDYPGEQHAIVQGRVNSPDLPRIDVVAQPVYPDPVAEALTSQGTQFQKGRRSFYYDVFNLLRENLIALGGLFSLLDDSFSNLALPLIGPEKNNRDSGSFTDANLLWGVWTIAKGTEQLSRAVSALDYSVQLARDGVKGQIATTQTLRLVVGKSTDTGVFAGQANPPTPPCTPACTPIQVEQWALSLVDQLAAESIWANLKDLEYLAGGIQTANDPRPYLPEAPASEIASNPTLAVVMSITKLKLAIVEHDLYCLVYENHENECSTILGATYKPGATGWDKLSFVKFPFGQIEVEQGLNQINVEGTKQIKAALGNKIQPNSFVWGTKVIVEGIEALLDSFHQLGATWRYVADSIANFGIFGIETSRSILQMDINAIDIDSAAKAAAAQRALENNTFFGKPEAPEKVQVQGQLVLSFSTDPEPISTRSTAARVAAGLSLFGILAVLLMHARFRWFLI